MRKVVLSGRLQMLADMAAPCCRVVDVGCDHGFLSAYLVQSGICSGALALDVRRGPLANAEKHIAELGLGDYIETRLSDGLAEYSTGEADLLICAGMGGRLMERILTAGMEKARALNALVLQPQSELGEFRAFLRSAGFIVVSEDAVCEDGKYYFAMKAVPGQRGLCGGAGGKEVRNNGCVDLCLGDMYGTFLLEARHPVLKEYLEQRRRYLRRLAASLMSKNTERAGERCLAVKRELWNVEKALAYFAASPVDACER